MSDSTSTKLILEALQKPCAPAKAFLPSASLSGATRTESALTSEPSSELAELLANILGPDFKKQLNPAEG